MNGDLQIVAFLLALVACVKPLGMYMANVYEGKRTFLSSLLVPVEKAIYRLAGIDPDREQDWRQYTVAVLGFSALGLVATYAVQRLQSLLPLNPEGFPAVAPDLAFNTAVSFVTNTDWQSYGGETTLGYLTQAGVLGVQNFLSAATGMAVLVALIRGFARREAVALGNFWVDLTRSVVHVLLPLSLVLALILAQQGVIQNFAGHSRAVLVEPVNASVPQTDASGKPVITADGKPLTATHQFTYQDIPGGPAASQIAIKQLGTNGGGFFNANSAHPFENPTPLTNLLETLAILLIPAALCFTFGQMVGDRRQGWALLATMMILFVPFAFAELHLELAGNPALASLHIDQTPSAIQAGGSMEGKEQRFGIAGSALWATATTAASNGSVNSAHDSYTPLGGLIPILLMDLSEVVFGGVGSGLYGMVMFAIAAVFIAGLMVGRTPEYLGKKIEAFEVKMVSLVLLLPPVTVLVGTAIACVVPAGTAAVGNPGAHGFSEILYAFSSAGNNNGSAFGGLSANSAFYNLMLAAAMWISRFWLIVPVLAIAGSLAAKRRVAVTEGTLPTHTPLFVAILVAVVLLIGALNFVPAIALGPIVEHLQMTTTR